MAEQSSAQASFLDRLSERIEDTMGVKAVFGQPIERDGTIVVPVAKARWGIGGGQGPGAGEAPKRPGGGGGGGTISPLGFIELTEGYAKFRPIRSSPLMILAGTLLGLSLLRAVVALVRPSPRRRLALFGPRHRKLVTMW